MALSVAPNGLTLASGSTQQFTATAITSSGASSVATNVTWSSSATGILTIDPSTGLATTANAGLVTVTATVGSVSGTAQVKVGDQSLASVAITPATSSIAKGTSQQLRFIGTFTDGTTQDLTSSATWSSTNTSVATVDTLGKATGVAVGSSTIRATFNGQSATATLTVTSATLVSIAVSPVPTAGLVVGTTAQLSATGTFSDGTTQNLTATATWSSTSTGVATVNAAGLVSAVSAGTTNIRAVFGSVTGSTSVTVANKTLVTLVVSPSTQSFALGTTGQLRAIGFFNDNSSQDLTTSVSWASTNTGVFTIGNTSPTQGLVTPVTGGTANATATYNVSGTPTVAQAAITVTAATLKSVAVTPTDSKVNLRQNVQFSVTGTFTDNTTQDLTGTAAFSATPNATIPGGNAQSPITTSGLFVSNVTGPYNVTAAVNISGVALNVSTTITVTQSPASGELVFTGYSNGQLSASTVDASTGIISTIAGYPHAGASAAPVVSLQTSPEYPVVYTSQWDGLGTDVVTIGSFAIAADGTISAGSAVPGNSGTTPVPPITTGDLAIVSNSNYAVFPTSILVPGSTTYYNVQATPLYGNGAIDLNSGHLAGNLDTTLADSTNSTIAAFNDITGSPNYFFTTDLNVLSSYTVQGGFINQSASSYTLPGITNITTDPAGSILVGINNSVGSNPTTNSLAVFTIDPANGQLNLVQQAVTHLGSAPTKVRTNGTLIWVLSRNSTVFETFYYNPVSHTLNSLGTQYTGNGPVDIDFDATLQYLYVANGSDGTVSAFAITNATTSTPTYGSVSGSPFSVGTGVTTVRVQR